MEERMCLDRPPLDGHCQKERGARWRLGGAGGVLEQPLPQNNDQRWSKLAKDWSLVKQ